MYVFYYIHGGKTYFTCARGLMPTKNSPVWQLPSASAWLIPNTQRDYEGEDE